jgi:pimeloyl-ACP methyl ester carboxylesterase
MWKRPTLPSNTVSPSKSPIYTLPSIDLQLTPHDSEAITDTAGSVAVEQHQQGHSHRLPRILLSAQLDHRRDLPPNRPGPLRRLPGRVKFLDRLETHPRWHPPPWSRTSNPGIDYKVVVVGHSLGAAIASLAAADLLTKNYNAILYAYAAPRWLTSLWRNSSRTRAITIVSLIAMIPCRSCHF